MYTQLYVSIVTWVYKVTYKLEHFKLQSQILELLPVWPEIGEIETITPQCWFELLVYQIIAATVLVGCFFSFLIFFTLPLTNVVDYCSNVIVIRVLLFLWFFDSSKKVFLYIYFLHIHTQGNKSICVIKRQDVLIGSTSLQIILPL